MHPGHTAVFFFDNSSCHGAFAPDALIAKHMNVNPGGKQPKMHSTRIPDDNPDPHLRGQEQLMVYPDDHPQFPGQPKGMAAVLRERGLWETLERARGGRKPVGTCSDCQMSQKKRDEAIRVAKAELEANPESFSSLGGLGPSVLFRFTDTPEAEDAGLADEPEPAETDGLCCMTKCMQLQADFVEEKPLLQLVIEAAGHKCLFLPKFHCELNPIERYWSYSKRSTSHLLFVGVVSSQEVSEFREQCNGSFPQGRAILPGCLASATVSIIRAYFRKSWRYMDAYRSVGYWQAITPLTQCSAGEDLMPRKLPLRSRNISHTAASLMGLTQNRDICLCSCLGSQ
jgi:hypothetical protein